MEIFNLDKLNKLYETEQSNNKRKFEEKKAFAEENGFCIPKHALQPTNKEEFDGCFPETIAYLLANVFKRIEGGFYILTINPDGNISPKQYKGKDFDQYYDLWPKDTQTYWNKHARQMYAISCDVSQSLIYKDEHNISYLNLFQGFKYAGKVRNTDLCNSKAADVQAVWLHIKNVWCNKSEIFYREIKNWICKLIGGRKKMTTAIYLKGAMGIGKGCIVNMFMDIIGRGNCVSCGTDRDFTEKFNGHLAGKLLVHADEIEHTQGSFKSFYNCLKAYITDPYHDYEMKGLDKVNLRNVMSLIMTGNHDMMSLETTTGKCRRFIILDADNTARDMSKLLKLTINAEVQEAFYWDCVDHYDPTYNEQETIKTLPYSDTKKAMMAKVMPLALRFFKSQLDDYEFFQSLHKPSSLHQMYAHWVRGRNETDKKFMNAQNMSDFCNYLTQDQDLKQYFSRKDGRITNSEGKSIPYKNIISIDGPALFKYMIKMGYINTDWECENVAPEFMELLQDKEVEAIMEEVEKVKVIREEVKEKVQLFSEEYWKQQNEIRRRMREEEMRALGIYEYYMSYKEKQQPQLPQQQPQQQQQPELKPLRKVIKVFTPPHERGFNPRVRLENQAKLREVLEEDSNFVNVSDVTKALHASLDILTKSNNQDLFNVYQGEFIN